MPTWSRNKRRLAWLLVALTLASPLACDLTAPSGQQSDEQPYRQQLPLVVGPPTSAAGQPADAAYPGAEQTPPADPGAQPQLNVRVSLQADRLALPPGETVLLTAEVAVEGQGCSYPLYEISLQENTPGQVEFVSPQVVGPPGQSPSTFEVRPLQAGQVSLFARAYGEVDCGQGMTWQYYTSEPLVLQVGP